MKKIFGLDLGTNSIGAAIINIPEDYNDYGKDGNIEWTGSRIIPMVGYVQSTGKPLKQGVTPEKAFTSGVGISKAATRRIKRGSRRLKQRYVLRRTRLIKVFKILGWLPKEFPENFKTAYRDDENFKFHISDFLPFAEETVVEAKLLLGATNKKGKVTLPEDWIVYYLRKKGLTEKLSFAELARIIYMMNQRRGFKSSRKDLKDESVEEVKWVEILKIKSVTQIEFEPNKNKNFKFEVTPDKLISGRKVNPWIVERKKKPEWEGKEFTCLITERVDIKKDGTKKTLQNNPKVIDRKNKDENWELCMVAQDNKMGDSFPGAYFFNGLVDSVQNKTDFKIRQYAVYRSKYKRELEAIWNKQLELNEELQKLNNDADILREIAKTLYPKQSELNKPKLKEILNNSLLHLISDDIIYYQRELKSQKNTKSECPYEKKKGIDGNLYGLKCAAKSSPEFQEFRIWQDIHNIKVLQREGIKNKTINGVEKIFTVVDIDVSADFMDDEIKAGLFELFDTSEKVSEKQIFEVLNKNRLTKISEKNYRINMFFDGKDTLQGNETKHYFRKIFKKNDFEKEGEILLQDRAKLSRLWNILYSISLNDEEKTKQAIFKALTDKTNKRGKAKEVVFDFPDNVANALSTASEIESTKKYASFSSKAIKKLLPLMRCGRYWVENLVDEQVKIKTEAIIKRLEEINYNEHKLKDIADDGIPQQILKSFINQKHLLSGLKTYQACYLVYDRHSEKTDYTKYSDPKEFDVMKLLPNNSLRNPIVEQVVREALFVVKDLWEQYGQPDEIHIEVGRDLKKNAKERQKETEKTTNNAAERVRIKELLNELMNEDFEQYAENGQIETTRFQTKPNPDSPADIKKFALWKNTSGLSDGDFAKKIKEEKIPKNQEIKKYALWLSQKCVSPYTGKIIPLSKLFTDEYEVEHVLPRKLIKNDSINNLVISERGVNKAKDSELGAIFIANKNGGCEYNGIKYSLLKYDEYVEHCKRTFRGAKLKNLLATEIPDGFIERQINDTRYITRKISELLYPVAKGNLKAETDAEKGGIVFTIGSITDELKRNWGINKEWKKLIKPRFERLEKLNNAKYIYQNETDRNDIDFNVPDNEKLNTKRIDHRHHAMDAIIIAATTIEHIRYLNSLSAVDNDEELKQVKRSLVKGKIREFKLPWENFTKQTREHLQQTIVTFKSYNNVISKPTNKYQKWTLTNGKWELKEVKQQKPTNPNKKWLSVRESLFKEPQGIIYIKEIETKQLNNLRDILYVIKIQIERDKAQNTPVQKHTSYIYDQDYREDIKSLIRKYNSDLDIIEKELKKYLKQYKTLKDINGAPIREVRIAVFSPFAAKRVSLDNSFDHKKINKIPYGDKFRIDANKKQTIPQILHAHLEEYEKRKLNSDEFSYIDYNNLAKKEQSDFDQYRDSENIKNGDKLKEALKEAFSDEGLEALDKKVGMKIRMVTIKEEVGLKKNIQGKLIESDSNAYYVFYENKETKERSGFASISSYDFLQKKLKNEPLLGVREGCKVVSLQSNDLVYVPTANEWEQVVLGKEENEAIDWNDKKHIAERLYRVNDFSEDNIYFVPNSFSKDIMGTELHNSAGFKTTRIVRNSLNIDNFPKNGKEDLLYFIDNSHYIWKNNVWNKIEDYNLYLRPDKKDKESLIKNSCIKVKIDRLGNFLTDEDNFLVNSINNGLKEDGGICLDNFKNSLFDENNNQDQF